MTLRIVAEHADIWHALGDPETVGAEVEVLDDWCAEVGRDPAEIERSTTVVRHTGETRNADDFLALGFTDFVVCAEGPDWDLGPLKQALAWRDGLG